MKHSSIYFIFICIATGLLACSHFEVNPQISLPQHMDRLKSSRFLCETRYNSWLNGAPDLTMSVITRPATGDLSTPCLPSLIEFEKNKNEWLIWKNQSHYQCRIAGLLPAGTEFHIYKVDMPQQMGDGVPIINVIIDSGNFKGTLAYYKYSYVDEEDKHLVDEFLSQVS